MFSSRVPARWQRISRRRASEDGKYLRNGGYGNDAGHGWDVVLRDGTGGSSQRRARRYA